MSTASATNRLARELCKFVRMQQGICCALHATYTRESQCLRRRAALLVQEGAYAYAPLLRLPEPVFHPLGPRGMLRRAIALIRTIRILGNGRVWRDFDSLAVLCWFCSTPIYLGCELSPFPFVKDARPPSLYLRQLAPATCLATRGGGLLGGGRAAAAAADGGGEGGGVARWPGIALRRGVSTEL